MPSQIVAVKHFTKLTFLHRSQFDMEGWRRYFLNYKFFFVIIRNNWSIFHISKSLQIASLASRNSQGQHHYFDFLIFLQERIILLGRIVIVKVKDVSVCTVRL